MSKKYFVNLSNHTSKDWEDEQRMEAEKYGEIVDFPFPSVLPDAEEEDITEMAEELFRKIMDLHPSAVMCQGEFTLTFSVITKLKEAGIPCLAACSQRVVEKEIRKNGSVTKVSEFRFVRFRQYV